MHFQEFWDSCAQNKTSGISKDALSGILGSLRNARSALKLRDSEMIRDAFGMIFGCILASFWAAPGITLRVIWAPDSPSWSVSVDFSLSVCAFSPASSPSSLSASSPSGPVCFCFFAALLLLLRPLRFRFFFLFFFFFLFLILRTNEEKRRKQK